MNKKKIYFLVKIIVLFLVLCLCGCTYNIKKDINWKTVTIFKEKQTYEKKIDWTKVQVGDILVKECDGGFLGWFGHCSIVVSSDTTAEIPKLGEKVYYRKIEDWQEMRRVIVLRYKNIDKQFKYYLFQEVKDNIGKPYLLVEKENDNGYYCSQFIWQMFRKTGKKLGKNIDIDSNGGLVVWPWDMIGSDELEIIDIMN